MLKLIATYLKLFLLINLVCLLAISVVNCAEALALEPPPAPHSEQEAGTELPATLSPTAESPTIAFTPSNTPQTVEVDPAITEYAPEVASIEFGLPKEDISRLGGVVGFSVFCLDSDGQRIDEEFVSAFGVMEILIADSKGNELYHKFSREKDLGDTLSNPLVVIPYKSLTFKDRDLDSVVLTIIVHREGKLDLRASMPLTINESEIDPRQLQN